MPDKYTSRANSKIKSLAQIAKKPRPECFIAEGFHMVEMALQSGAVVEIFAVEDPKIEGAKVSLVTQEIVEKICQSKNPEPIFALCSLKDAKENLGNRILILDRLQDPGNVGTLLRTACAFGFHDVFLLPGTCSPFNAKSLASSQGAIFRVRLKMIGFEDLQKLSTKGYEIIGTSLTDSKPLKGYEPKEKLALILGNEGRGMSQEAKQKCDTLLKISIATMESLNVAAAGAIFMHQFALI